MLTVDAQTGNTAVDGAWVTDATTLLNTLTVSNATRAEHFGCANTFEAATNKFVVDHSSGNTAVAGTLGVTGATTLATLLMSLTCHSPGKHRYDAVIISFEHSAASGGLAITSTNGYVDIEEARSLARRSALMVMRPC